VAFTPLLFVNLELVLILVLLLVFVLLFCVFYFAYVTVLEGFWGRTLGKALLGIEVIREEDGGVPGPSRAALRALMFLFVDMFVGNPSCPLQALNREGQQEPDDFQLEASRRDRVDLLGKEAPQPTKDRFYVLANRLAQELLPCRHRPLLGVLLALGF
jgi:hypothetical protein